MQSNDHERSADTRSGPSEHLLGTLETFSEQGWWNWSCIRQLVGSLHLTFEYYEELSVLWILLGEGERFI
jgi:hypothetical protein